MAILSSITATRNCTRYAWWLMGANNSFKPSPLRGLVFAVTFTTTLSRYAGRLNSGVRTRTFWPRFMQWSIAWDSIIDLPCPL